MNVSNPTQKTKKILIFNLFVTINSTINNTVMPHYEQEKNKTICQIYKHVYPQSKCQAAHMNKYNKNYEIGKLYSSKKSVCGCAHTICVLFLVINS